MTAGETWDSCLDEIRNLPACKKYGDDVKVSMYLYDRPAWTGLKYETECYFPTWINKESAPHVKALAQGFYGIADVRQVKAEGLDMIGADVKEILNKAVGRIQA